MTHRSSESLQSGLQPGAKSSEGPLTGCGACPTGAPGFTLQGKTRRGLFLKPGILDGNRVEPIY